MRNFGDDDGKISGAFGHLQLDIIAVIRKAGDLYQRSGSGMRGTVDFLLAGEIIGNVFHGGFAAHDLGGSHYGVDERLVAGAAADILMLLEPFTNIFTGGSWIFSQQP